MVESKIYSYNPLIEDICIGESLLLLKTETQKPTFPSFLEDRSAFFSISAVPADVIDI
ncbi:MAG: hypothetical protein ACLTR4_02675 [Gallintestinimicrobium sp.]